MAFEEHRFEMRETSRGTLLAGAAEIRSALEVLDTVAATDCTVLVTGESGTGKELAVAALHDASRRSGGPLVAVNCGAIPETLMESEIFGHVRGAFTGAIGREGHVGAARGGTLFLDEIGELPLPMQVKLLRLLQAKEYNVVGESKVSRADVRIAAATNRDLAREVKAGRFREDLYYRLNVIHVELPPLRRRRDDIAPLAIHFLSQAAQRLSSRARELSPAALARLVAADWPGNIRALQNAIERAVLLARGPVVDDVIVPAEAPPSSRGGPSTGARASGTRPRWISIPPPPVVAETASLDLRATVDAFETAIVLKVLERVGWNRSHAAAQLGIHRTTLIDMIKRKKLRPSLSRVA